MTNKEQCPKMSQQTKGTLGDDVVEAIEVDVEEGSIDQEAKLQGKVPDDISAIKVDDGDDINRRIVKRHGVEDIMIVAHVEIYLVPDEIVKVQVYDILLCHEK
ncbi:hypothetical protein OPV22_023118 [Ensete ventricosum]|uniref:Uncharacterized protein n=1 Tax=Ensete ventricosum TaxID=4639 RepID=A0AAV8PCG0_ENSVE|nr:hypothetical protein OPV22_023118 [Ensete ventricosum]